MPAFPGGAIGGGIVGSAVVRLLLDDKQLHSGLSGAHKKFVTGATAMERRASVLGGSLTRNLTVPFGLAAIAAIKMASDAEEVENKVRVTFGNMSDSVLRWSETSIDKMGAARQTAQEMASQFGLLFQAAKLPGPEVVNLSKRFTQLAGDMSSFFNIPFEEALQVLRSGLVGETEPLRRFGVLLSEAAVSAKAAALGMGETKAEVTEAEKVMARAAIITDSLAKAQGDFARTQNSVANQSRKAREQLKDLGAELGKELLPVAKDVLQAVRGLVGAFTDLPEPVQDAAIKFGLVAIAAGPVLKLLAGLVGIIRVVGPALVAFSNGPMALLIATFIAAHFAIGKFHDAFGTIGQQIAKALPPEFYKALTVGITATSGALDSLSANADSAATNALRLARAQDALAEKARIAAKHLQNQDSVLANLANRYKNFPQLVIGAVPGGGGGGGGGGGTGSLPIHHMGGPVHRTGPALLQRGEHILSAQTVKALGRLRSSGGDKVVQIIFQGPVYGTADFDRHVEQALTRSASRFAGI